MYRGPTQSCLAYIYSHIIIFINSSSKKPFVLYSRNSSHFVRFRLEIVANLDQVRVERKRFLFFNFASIQTHDRKDMN